MKQQIFGGTSVRTNRVLPEMLTQDRIAGKFLVDHEGTPFKRYPPKTCPFEIKADIEKLLANKIG